MFGANVKNVFLAPKGGRGNAGQIPAARKGNDMATSAAQAGEADVGRSIHLAVRSTLNEIAIDPDLTVEGYLYKVADVCVELLDQHAQRRIEDFRHQAAQTRAVLEKKFKSSGMYE